MVLELSNEALEVLKKGYAYIDPEDNQIFQDFAVDTIRLEKEREGSGKMLVPVAIYRRVGDMYYMRNEFIERVEEKFKEKRTILETLGK